jgi:hypothetical protein
MAQPSWYGNMVETNTLAVTCCGLVIGPVVLTLARELWEQRVRDLALPKVADATSPTDDGT